MKTKEIPFSNKATEVEKGVWEWTTGKTKWQYVACVTSTPNLSVWNEEMGDWQPACYCRDHREAGCFAEGFAAATEVNNYKDYIVK